jgi:hypothetical protein
VRLVAFLPLNSAKVMSLFRTTKCDLNLAAKSNYAHYVITAMGKPAMVYVCRRTESNGRIDPAYLTEKFDTYFKQKSKEAAPSMGTIEFINKGKGSAVLRTAAIEVLKAKRQKLQDAQYGTAQSPPKQQNNKIVLEYLALYLQGMGCGL